MSLWIELGTHEEQSKVERSETQHLIGTTPVVDPLKLHVFIDNTTVKIIKS